PRQRPPPIDAPLRKRHLAPRPPEKPMPRHALLLMLTLVLACSRPPTPTPTPPLPAAQPAPAPPPTVPPPLVQAPPLTPDANAAQAPEPKQPPLPAAEETTATTLADRPGGTVPAWLPDGTTVDVADDVTVTLL